MATKPHITDAETAEMERLMNQLCPNRAEEWAALPRRRTLAESIEMLRKLEALHGPAIMDDDFARDIEEGRRLLRQDAKVDLWD